MGHVSASPRLAAHQIGRAIAAAALKFDKSPSGVKSPMANTYTSLHYHFTCSTKNREPWIALEIENRVWAFIGGIARHYKMTALQVGGIADHIHALVMAPPTLSPSEIAQYLKGESSKWIHEEFPKLRGFEWQDGYGGFTVSKSQIPDVIAYIQKQREHHRKKTFQDEYLELLMNYEVDYDERYLWG
jgi:REP element-mobilizing transposase RayT